MLPPESDVEVVESVEVVGVLDSLVVLLLEVVDSVELIDEDDEEGELVVETEALSAVFTVVPPHALSVSAAKAATAPAR
ncbi:hypothetical protein GCM10027579_21390 [Calidifontibacter terrae]